MLENSIYMSFSLRCLCTNEYNNKLFFQLIFFYNIRFAAEFEFDDIVVYRSCQKSALESSCCL